MAETSAEEKTPKKRGRKPGSKKSNSQDRRTTCNENERNCKRGSESWSTGETDTQKAKKEETPAIPEEKEVILPELEFGSETDDFIPIEDLPSEK